MYITNIYKQKKAQKKPLSLQKFLTKQKKVCQTKQKNFIFTESSVDILT